MSFPRSVGQIPVYYSHLNTGRPYNADKAEQIHFALFLMKLTGALYPFGYGLSYTTFTVSDVKLSAPTMKRDGKVTASVQVTNTGKREGGDGSADVLAGCDGFHESSGEAAERL